MTQTHGQIERGNPRCLHCVLNYCMGKWAERNARRNADGVIVLDISEVIPKIAQLIGGLVYESQDPIERRKFERYAQECLEGAFEHERAGAIVSVSVNDGPAS
jgi:CobQ-like glutamine amidotransferase family enzyme